MVFPSSPKAGDNVRVECFAMGYSDLWVLILSFTNMSDVRELACKAEVLWCCRGNLQYQWFKEDGPMPQRATITDYGRVLNIPNIEISDKGTYRCKVTRLNGQSDQATVLLPVDGKWSCSCTLLSLLLALITLKLIGCALTACYVSNIRHMWLPAEPFFTIPLKNQIVDLAGTVTLRCVASGIPTVVYSWWKNSMELKSDTLPAEDRQRITVSNNVLTITNVGVKDNGMYQCAASNLYGIRYSSAQLRVLSMFYSFTFLTYHLMLL